MLKKLLSILTDSSHAGKQADQNAVRSAAYWEERYRQGNNSGAGSYGAFADFKAEVVNGLVRKHDIRSVIEFGSGDGNQLSLLVFPSYTGVDVSPTAIESCRRRFAADPTKRFLLDEGQQPDAFPRAEMSMSLDVIYHLVDDAVFDRYMTSMFTAATRSAVFYASNGDPCNGAKQWSRHVRHRRFTDWIELHRPEWRLLEYIPNRYHYDCKTEEGSFADFYIYSRG